MKLCSACLLGINCRYDGGNKANEKVIELSKHEKLIPVCPERLGGLPVPRDAAERRGKKVFTGSGKDVTDFFRKGAKTVLDVARNLNTNEAILKQRSSSCGSGQIYDGTFSGKVIEGDGVTAELLKANGIKIITEEDL